MAMKGKLIAPRRRGGGEGALVGNLRMVWLLIGIGILVVAAAAVLHSVASAIWAVLAAALVVFILKSPVAWLERKGIPRVVSSIVLVLLLALAIVGVVVSFFPMILGQIAELIEQLPNYMNAIADWWSAFVAAHPDILDSSMVQSIVTQLKDGIESISIQSAGGGIIGGVYQAGMSFAGVLVMGFTAFIVAFWILIDYETITHEMHVLGGRTSKWYVILISTIFSRVIGGYIKGTLIGAAIISVICGIAYWILGLPYPLVLGIMSGLFSIIPYVGPVISTIAIAFLSLFSGGLVMIVAVIVSMVVPWGISTFVSPKVMSSTVNLHPGVSLVAIVVGSSIGGIMGMILAIPVMAVIKCLFVYFFESITGRQLVSENGALFDGHPGDTVDPVADATDNFINEKQLREMVEQTEDEVTKLEELPARNMKTLFSDLAHPMNPTPPEESVDSDDEGAED